MFNLRNVPENFELINALRAVAISFALGTCTVLDKQDFGLSTDCSGKSDFTFETTSCYEVCLFLDFSNLKFVLLSVNASHCSHKPQGFQQRGGL